MHLILKNVPGFTANVGLCWFVNKPLAADDEDMLALIRFGLSVCNLHKEFVNLEDTVKRDDGDLDVYLASCRKDPDIKVWLDKVADIASFLFE